jgi:hypothetical protein
MAAAVNGLGLWAPGFRDLGAWLAGVPDAAVTVPAGDALPALLRRRATSLASMAADVAGQAARQAGADLSSVPLIVASAYGEIATAVEMMRSFRQDVGMPSPTRFHNSVHNTAAAYLSIAMANHGFSTTLAAGTATPAAALFEAEALLAERGGEVLVLLLDEPPPEPFTFSPTYPIAAAAIHLSAEAGPRVLATLAGLRRGNGQRPELPNGLAVHPCAGGFALVAAIARRVRGPVALGPFGEEGFVVDVEPAGVA